MVKRACGNNDIAYILQISSTTVIKRIRQLAKDIKPPAILRSGQKYQVDELATNIWKNNQKQSVFLSYAFLPRTSQVPAFTIGGRDKGTLSKVINVLLQSKPKKILTDGYVTYPSIIPKQLHSIRYGGTNNIERMNLTLRTHIKRLNRNVLCQSKKLDMLENWIKIYFWG